MSRQCILSGTSRAIHYAQQKPKELDEDDELLKRLIDEEYTGPLFTAAVEWWCTWAGAATVSTVNDYSV